MEIPVHRPQFLNRGLDPDKLDMAPIPGLEGTRHAGNVFEIYVDGTDAEPWRRMDKALGQGKFVALWPDNETGVPQDVWYSPDNTQDVPLTPDRISEWSRFIHDRGLVTQLSEWMDYLTQQVMNQLADQLKD